MEWTDAAGKVRRKAFVWRGPADREAAYLRRRGFDARVVTLPRTPTDGAEG